MLDCQLFLGLPLTDSYRQELSQLPASVHDVFIQNSSSSYLQQVESEGIVYLGKFLGSSLDLATLDVLEVHIYSLLKRLISDYPYEQHPLLLLAIPYDLG